MSKYEHHQSHDNLRKFLLGLFILQKQWDPNFLHDCFSKILRTFFVKKLIPYKTYVQEKHVESILGTCNKMTKKVFNLNTYRLTVTIISQKYWELSLQIEISENRSIPSMHAKRKITICSHKHSFTPYQKNYRSFS